eukprot:Gregarina_sp_Poly_1__10495@NODE_76_length_15862_cov_98_864577_g65_i0_p7_GENE_NODE_76_length_15862_cov_98_864577_g65_i0NODE_76_length_15862_cov_98_864577_g65_i0_p7_ORF_typecomplete_len282_score56_90SEO_N/PF14576_6/2e02SEO_N/PF14576_6/0_059Golgin_A5/PF09787_9/0_12DUF3829/PF12889_7/2_2zfC4H2/PF10146_9/1_5e02zfC4H2/PF10146_9/4_7e02_NODE_76_length_15862_cov_98_864577_g65_i021793024
MSDLLRQTFNAEKIYTEHARAKSLSAEIHIKETQKKLELEEVKEEGRHLAKEILVAVEEVLRRLKAQYNQEDCERLEIDNQHLKTLLQSENKKCLESRRGLEATLQEYKYFENEAARLKSDVHASSVAMIKQRREATEAKEDLKNLTAANKLEEVLLARITRCMGFRQLDRHTVECDVVKAAKKAVHLRLPYKSEGLTASEVDYNWQLVAQNAEIDLESIYIQFPEVTPPNKTWMNERGVDSEKPSCADCIVTVVEDGSRLENFLSPGEKTKRESRASVSF